MITKLGKKGNRMNIGDLESKLTKTQTGTSQKLNNDEKSLRDLLRYLKGDTRKVTF